MGDITLSDIAGLKTKVDELTSVVMALKNQLEQDATKSYSPQEVARMTGVSVKLVYQWLHSGELKSWRTVPDSDTSSRSGWRITQAALNRFIDERAPRYA